MSETDQDVGVFCIRYTHRPEVIGVTRVEREVVDVHDDNLIYDGPREGDDKDTHEIHMQFPKDVTAFYILNYSASGEGQSYFDSKSMSIYASFVEVMQVVAGFYAEDHQYDEDCEVCTDEGSRVCHRRAMATFRRKHRLHYIGSESCSLSYRKVRVQ